MKKIEQDWIFDTDTCRCDLRSAGVLLQDGKVFLQRSAGGSEYALPGGHVRAGETTEHALLREWQEEMAFGWFATGFCGWRNASGSREAGRCTTCAFIT